MKTIYPFKESGLYVWPIRLTSKATQKRLARFNGSHVVMSTGKIIYAVCVDEDEANKAMKKIMSA